MQSCVRVYNTPHVGRTLQLQLLLHHRGSLKAHRHAQDLGGAKLVLGALLHQLAAATTART
jgi:hypothetical protein